MSLVQLGIFSPEAPTVQAVTPTVYLQGRTWCKACRRRHAEGINGACNKCRSEVHEFTSVPSCAAWLLSSATYHADEYAVVRDGKRGNELLTAGYAKDVRQWAQNTTQEG